MGIYIYAYIHRLLKEHMNFLHIFTVTGLNYNWGHHGPPAVPPVAWYKPGHVTSKAFQLRLGDDPHFTSDLDA